MVWVLGIYLRGKFNEDKKNWFKNDNRKKGINRKDTGDVVFFGL